MCSTLLKLFIFLQGYSSFCSSIMIWKPLSRYKPKRGEIKKLQVRGNCCSAMQMTQHFGTVAGFRENPPPTLLSCVWILKTFEIYGAPFNWESFQVQKPTWTSKVGFLIDFYIKWIIFISLKTFFFQWNFQPIKIIANKFL